MPVELRDEDFEVAQALAAKDRSNLYLTSQFLVDRDRYRAFCALYALMRVIDDAIDGVVDKDLLGDAGRAALQADLDGWWARIEAAYAGRPDDQPLDRALAWAVQKFPVPIALWHRFIEAMRYDVEHPRFADFETFVEYAEGATVAPTTIYVYLLVAAPEADGSFRVADFDYRRCGRELGLFAYLAHVLRDVRSDALVGNRGLVYLGLADLAACDLTDRDLRRWAEAGCSDARWQRLVRLLVERALPYHQRGAQLVAEVAPRLAPDRRFVLSLIVAYYRALLERIGALQVDLFSGAELLRGADKLAIALQVAHDVEFDIPADAFERFGRAASSR
ncbi:MAG: squalene/phytoene synthase family protein [Deltaproteobacteria bacterium]|nr:squalene/phytoene synthase family protein [Deltaproteobacteria bacterium]